MLSTRLFRDEQVAYSTFRPGINNQPLLGLLIAWPSPDRSISRGHSSGNNFLFWVCLRKNLKSNRCPKNSLKPRSRSYYGPYHRGTECYCPCGGSNWWAAFRKNRRRPSKRVRSSGFKNNYLYRNGSSSRSPRRQTTVATPSRLIYRHPTFRDS